jgi:hypothetical protein
MYQARRMSRGVYMCIKVISQENEQGCIYVY